MDASVERERERDKSDGRGRKERNDHLSLSRLPNDAAAVARL